MKNAYYLYLFVLYVLFVSFFVSANESISVMIIGPKKVFTNDRVVYGIRIINSNVAQVTGYVWKKDGIVSGDESECEITAGSSQGTINLTCHVTVRAGSETNFEEFSLDSEINICVVIPVISVERASYLESDFIGTNTSRHIVDIGGEGRALLHKNGMCLFYERFYLEINILPDDIDVEEFSITVSDPQALSFYNTPNSLDTRNLPEIDYGWRVITHLNTFSDYLAMFIEGTKCSENIQVKVSINHNEKLSLDYGVFGFENTSLHYPTEQLYCYYTPGTHLVDNEWAYKPNSINPKYNCLAYAMINSGKINNKFFWVTDVLWPCPTYVYIDKFVNNPNYTNEYLTSMDTFGNDNGTFDSNDINLFFMSFWWGNNRAYGTTSSYSNCRKIYYNSSMCGPNFHAARISQRTEGCHSNWHVFESKIGEDHIIIHRAEQLEGDLYGTIQQMYR